MLEAFIKEACLTPEEEHIMRTRVAGWTRIQQAEKLGMSVSTVDAIIKRLKIKYDEAQKYSLILPPRKSSVQETYQDTH